VLASRSLADRLVLPFAALAWFKLDLHGDYRPCTSPGSLPLPGALGFLLHSFDETHATSKGTVAKRLSMESSPAPTLCLAPWITFHNLLTAPPAQASTFASSTLPVSWFDCLAIIDSSSGSSSRYLPVPPISRTVEPSHAPVVDSSRTPMGAPPPFRRARNNENPSSDSFFDTQLKESFTILFGLVFKLRQGVEDLNSFCRPQMERSRPSFKSFPPSKMLFPLTQ
jgi:hypothetical protein